MLKFASTNEALQHLSNLTGKKIIVDSKGKYYITVTEYAISKEHLETIASKILDDAKIENYEVYSNDKEGLENLIVELKKKGVSSSDSVKTASIKIANDEYPVSFDDEGTEFPEGKTLEEVFIDLVKDGNYKEALQLIKHQDFIATNKMMHAVLDSNINARWKVDLASDLVHSKNSKIDETDNYIIDRLTE